MQLSIEREDSCLVLAYLDGVAVGYGKANACTPEDPADTAPPGYYLTGLAVLKPWRRCGVANGITFRRLTWIWSRHQAAWFFTDAYNRASLAMHVKLGFTEVGRAAGYLGEPFEGGTGVLMRADRQDTEQGPTRDQDAAAGGSRLPGSL